MKQRMRRERRFGIGGGNFNSVEQRGTTGGGTGVSPVHTWRKAIPGREMSKCKCPEVGASTEQRARRPAWLEQSEVPAGGGEIRDIMGPGCVGPRMALAFILSDLPSHCRF